MENFYSVLAKILESVVNNYSDEIAYAILSVIVAAFGFLLTHIKNAYILSAMQSVEKAVVIVGQTIVDDLKAKSTDGKLTDEEKSEVKNHAVIIAKQQLGVVGTFIMNIVTGSADKWIQYQVEFIVGKIKSASNSADNK